MMRRWMILAAVATVAILAIFLSALPPRDDGLNWIRGYSPGQHIPYRWSTEGGGPTFVGSRHVFQFKTVPSTLVADLRRNLVQTVVEDRKAISGVTREGWQVLLSYDTGTVECYRGEYLNGFEAAWLRVKQLLGLPW